MSTPKSFIYAVTYDEVELRDGNNKVVAIIKTPRSVFNIDFVNEPGKPYVLTITENMEHAKKRIGPPWFKD